MQLNRVSREQSAAKEGVVLQQSIQSAVLQKKQEDEVRSVQKPQAEENSGKVGDREQGASSESGSEGKENPEEQEESGEREVVRDPNLGRRVDISG